MLCSGIFACIVSLQALHLQRLTTRDLTHPLIQLKLLPSSQSLRVGMLEIDCSNNLEDAHTALATWQ
jgi:hypothetical protein